MNLDLLIKLVKLANNNPNDNEANAAARKACKLIAEADYKFNGSEPKTWNDVRRSQEPEFRSTPPRSSDWFYNWYSREYERTQRAWEEDAKRREDERKERERKRREEQYRPKYSWHDTKYYDPQKYTYSKEGWSWEPVKDRAKEKKSLNCKRCGKAYMTAFVGPESQFQCNKCHWDEYNQKEKQEYKRK